jgi:K+-sensing histidine kinase KdpD
VTRIVFGITIVELVRFPSRSKWCQWTQYWKSQKVLFKVSTWSNIQHQLWRAFKTDITQITYKNKACKHTRFTNNTWSILIPPKSSEIYERHSCSIDLFLLLSHFHFTCQTVVCSIVCNMFVNRVCLHALFLYVICVMSVLKALQSWCCMLLHVLTLNKTCWLFHLELCFSPCTFRTDDFQIFTLSVIVEMLFEF